ncbi:Hypothetical predicted protein [Cloeon dipterum]|uniref:C-type lectin domain-containing protein n=1 Tax=Cloeon dipterum TaxID=197152 RepID=A0A8S1CNZ2_9INSE|nr:Hypothetical predicted protein [Cloeon dipterum]
MPKLVVLVLVWVTAASAFPLLPSSSVNISDSWLLVDAESPVFYRHFRDKVTWAEAESVCQFHHSVLATVRNTAEFDRTRALLRQLEWTTPVWVGLRRDDGQPMFKWSTPAGATLEASEGYWNESPNVVTSEPQCVTIDPAADFRWRAVACSSTLEIHSFLCQIPVPSWVRSEHGGCLSPKWPNKEVTVQYNPQTHALEMIADCGLRGTKRIACKHNSEKEIRRLEHKLKCTEDIPSGKAATPVRPITRHRRDVQDESPAPTAELSTSSAAPQAGIDQTLAATRDEPTTEKATTSTAEKTTELDNSESVTEAPKTQASVDQAPSVSTTHEATSQMRLEPETTTEQQKSGGKLIATSVQSISSSSEAPAATTEAATSLQETHTQQAAQTASVTEAAPEKQKEPLPTESSKMNVEIIAHIFDTSTDGAAVSRVITVEELQDDDFDQASTRPEGQEEEFDIDQMQNLQPISVAKHHVVPGVPRNVPSGEMHHDPPHHPPLVIAITQQHNVSAGLPRIVAPPAQQLHPGQAPFMHHPMMHQGLPRNVGPEEIRSAEDHVMQRRKQFLPTPLQGPVSDMHPHAPMMAHQTIEEHRVQPTVSSVTVEVQTESDKTEEEDIEFQDEEPTALQEARQKHGGNKAAVLLSVKVEELESTEDTLNAETDEEMVAAEQRLKSRRTDEKPVERHTARSLYPFILNRLLG